MPTMAKKKKDKDGTKSSLPMKKTSGEVNLDRIREPFIVAMGKVVEDNILACNNFELWYLINQELPVEEQISFRDFSMIRNPLQERSRDTIKMSPFYLEARKIVIEALIKAKRDLLVKYQSAKNYIELRKCEFILQTRFKDWGVDISEEADVLPVGNTYNILIQNNHSAQPVRTELEMIKLMQNVDS